MAKVIEVLRYGRYGCQTQLGRFRDLNHVSHIYIYSSLYSTHWSDTPCISGDVRCISSVRSNVPKVGRLCATVTVNGCVCV